MANVKTVGREAHSAECYTRAPCETILLVRYRLIGKEAIYQLFIKYWNSTASPLRRLGGMLFFIIPDR
jgi:hypothetical protein